MTDRELLQQALDALEWAERRYSYANLDLFNKPIEALRTRLAQPEPEPEHVATIGNWGRIMWEEGVYPQFKDKLYTAPPKKEWVGLTDREIDDLDYSGTRVEFARDIEAKLKEKNT